MLGIECMEKEFDELMEADREAAERRKERAMQEREANRTFKLQTKIRLVEEGKSRIFENWNQIQGISKDDFIEGIRWLCDDPLTDGRVTRDLSCANGKLYRLERYRDNNGLISFFDTATGKRFDFCNGMAAGISVRDKI